MTSVTTIGDMIIDGVKTNMTPVQVFALQLAQDALQTAFPDAGLRLDDARGEWQLYVPDYDSAGPSPLRLVA